MRSVSLLVDIFSAFDGCTLMTFIFGMLNSKYNIIVTFVRSDIFSFSSEVIDYFMFFFLKVAEFIFKKLTL